ncbi:MAG: hypothetical protein IPP88_07275 [Betaproteobacteria bacterium]|nr:hypothetical protein [Betaproteobacteria bacterium]
MKIGMKILVVTCLTLSGAGAFAQTPSDAAAVPKQKVYALISAVGDQFTYVTQKQSVGSNVLDHYDRKVIKIPNDAINASVLKGLDNAIAQRDPGSTRILARLNPLEMDGVRPADREKIAMGKLIATLERFPQRQEWDTIIVVTPKFQFSERKGMGSKLEGIGVYVQPLESGKLTDDAGVDFLGDEGEETITPDGKPGRRSSTFVAPYNYTQTWVFDAKTLKVLETSARYEFQKIFDQESTALNVANSIPVAKLAQIFTTFVEKSVARGVGEALPIVEMGEIKPVAVQPVKPK